ncbi:MAG: HNH endonuclease [Phycisphaerales bacterium]
MSPATQRGKYADNWKHLATKVKDDANWQCVRCDHVHDCGSGHCLTVHHFDGNRDNNERWNLMALCQRCHLSVQARIDPDEPLLTEPSHWARPYIAGFYEAGNGIPGPTYDLEAWKDKYEASGRDWPAWAPEASS